MPFDPISLAVGATQTGMGLLQSIFSGRKKNERRLNAQIDQSPIYTQNQSILDYYNTALNRYNVSPVDSAMYKRQQQNIGRNQATGINALQDRRSGQAGISSILRAANDASLNAEVAAEQQKNQRFNELGGATNMKVNEDDKAFQQNELIPWELKTNLAAQKLQASSQRQNAGMQNIFGGFQTIGGGFTPGGGSGSGSGYNSSIVNQNQYGGWSPPVRSDIRLKENYFITGKSPSGINIYEFSYKGSSKRYVGVMAQEVPFASVEIDGYLSVDYSKIDVNFSEIY